MSTKTALIVLVVAALLIVVYIAAFGTPEAPDQPADDEDTSSTMRVEDNAVVATDQQPGEEVTVSQVFLAQEGYVVIHEDADGSPGAIIGASELLSAGQTDNVTVVLERATEEGETLYAMLHSDVDGDGTFDAAVDTPVMSSLGGPIVGSFTISSDASGAVDISL